jgi:hypothetical protein
MRYDVVDAVAPYVPAGARVVTASGARGVGRKRNSDSQAMPTSTANGTGRCARRSDGRGERGESAGRG